jgi:hypothetical protein
MSYPVINPPPIPANPNPNCLDEIVTLPVQSTTSLRFNMNITQGQNLVLKNVGTLNATYASDNVAQESVTIPPGEFYAVNQPIVALCVQVTAPAMVNLMLSGGVAFAVNVSNMFFIDEALQGFEVSAPAGTNAPTVRANLFYAIQMS